MAKRKTTKQILAESFLELLNTIPIEKITVQNIADNADVSRTTFYNNFVDTRQLVEWIFKTEVLDAARQSAEGGTYENAIKREISLIYENRAFFVKVYQADGYSDFFRQIAYESYHTYLEDLNATDPDLAFMMEFYSWGFSKKIFEWAKKGFKEPPEKITELVMECLPERLAQLILNEDNQSLPH